MASPIKTDASTPLSVDGPGGTCCTSGCFDKMFRMIVIDKGLVPELAVTATLPSRLRVNPYGCGAVTILFPAGVRYLPFGMTVLPLLSIFVNSLPAGAEISHNSFSLELLCLLHDMHIKMAHK